MGGTQVLLLLTAALLASRAVGAVVGPRLSEWAWAVDSLVTGALVVGSALVALAPAAAAEGRTRTRVALVAGLLLVGLGQVVVRPGPTGAAGDLLATTPLHLAGLTVLCGVGVSLALTRPGGGRRRVAPFAVDVMGAFVLVAMTSIAIGTWALAAGTAQLGGPQVAATTAAAVLLAIVVGAGAGVRPGWRHPVSALVGAASCTWVADVAVLAAPAHVPASAVSTVQLLALPALATAGTWLDRTAEGTEEPAADLRSTALPLLGAAMAVVGVLIVPADQIPAQGTTVLAAFGLVCLLATGWRVHGALQSVGRRVRLLEEPFRDLLTGLPDRRGLRAHLDGLTGPATFLVVDLDGFRRINEEAGHDTGDRVLVRVAEELTRLAGQRGLAARIDGDDFALVVPGDDADQAWRLATHVRQTLREPVELAGRRFHLSANVGIVLGHASPAALGTAESRADLLLRCSDLALAVAQAASVGLAVHDDEACRTVSDDPLLEIVAELHAALAVDDQLVVHLQPQHRLDLPGPLSAATVIGCEALVRWQHPTRGLVGPATILRAARSGHLGRALTARVLDLAAAAAATWWSTHQRSVAVNLTTEDLDDEQLPEQIAAVLARHGLPAAALTLEVVEDSLMVDPERAVRTLTALRTLGFTLAIDDYGTGYSSLAYLHRLPIDEVKFDRSLTAGIAEDDAATSTAIVRHSVRLAHELGLVVLAEGVECQRDLDRLRELGCDAVQGFHTGRPVPVAEWTAYLDGTTIG